MTDLNLIDSTRQYIISKITDNFTDTDIAYENINYSAKPDISFIQPVINYGDAVDIGLTEYNQIVGVLTIFVHTPLDQGKKENNILCDKARKLFNKLQTPSLVFKIPSNPKIVQADKHYTQKIVILFDLYESTPKQIEIA